MYIHIHTHIYKIQTYHQKHRLEDMTVQPGSGTQFYPRRGAALTQQLLHHGAYLLKIHLNCKLWTINFPCFLFMGIIQLTSWQIKPKNRGENPLHFLLGLTERHAIDDPFWHVRKDHYRTGPQSLFCVSAGSLQFFKIQNTLVRTCCRFFQHWFSLPY